MTSVNPSKVPTPIVDALAALENDERLDAVASKIQPAAKRLHEGALGEVLRGAWLGHPLHPMLTDLPIGCWTSSFILDVVGGRRSRTASQRLIALGLLAAIPTAASGAADWSSIGETPARRTGVAHAAANSAAAAIYLLSWTSRRRGHHMLGVALGFAAAGAATVGGYLGGHLAFPPAT